jgi:hypothetical protein
VPCSRFRCSLVLPMPDTWQLRSRLRRASSPSGSRAAGRAATCHAARRLGNLLLLRWPQLLESLPQLLLLAWLLPLLL